jgi:hypothetical protein
MKVAIMQPYFLPYLGYFQLINAVDVFVIYDNIQFTKKGWIHRNRMLVEGESKLFTVPLKKDSDFLNVNERFLSNDFENTKIKLLRTIKNNYHKAPRFKEVYAVLEHILNFEDFNLFNFVYHSIVEICEFLSIDTKLVISSSLDINHDLTSKDKVLAICKNQTAIQYYNTYGGIELYDKQEFLNEGIILSFMKSKTINYIQFNKPFVPWLSILDVMMFNSKEEIRVMLNEYTLL